MTSIRFRSFLSFFFINIDNPNEESTATEKEVMIRIRLGKNVGRKGIGSWKNHLVNGESRVRKKEKKEAIIKNLIVGFIFVLKPAYMANTKGISPA